MRPEVRIDTMFLISCTFPRTRPIVNLGNFHGQLILNLTLQLVVFHCVHAKYDAKPRTIDADDGYAPLDIGRGISINSRLRGSFNLFYFTRLFLNPRKFR